MVMHWLYMHRKTPIGGIRILKLCKGASLSVLCICACTRNSINKGETCLAIGDYQNAICFFQKAVNDNPASARSRRGIALSLLQQCSAHESEGKATPAEWKSALAALQYARRIKDNPDLKAQEAVANFKLAKALESRGDTSSALRFAFQALALQPQDVRMIDYAAVLSHRMGDAATARDLFLQATIVDSNDAVAFFDVGMLYWYSQNVLQAHDWWLKALKRSPTDTAVVYWVAKAELELKKMAGKK
jgi:tetratricopeptide (TPR) repeat protein